MSEDERKHLEMIQAVVARMAANSFALKGWSVTAATALLAFAAGTRHPWVALVALLPTLVFWALDGYYLALERRYRRLFYAAAKVRPPGEAAPPAAPALYDMTVPDEYVTKHPWTEAAFSRSVWPIHGVTAAAVAVVAGLVSSQPRRTEEPTRVQVADTVPVRVIQPPAPATPPQARPPAAPRATP